MFTMFVGCCLFGWRNEKLSSRFLSFLLYVLSKVPFTLFVNTSSCLRSGLRHLGSSSCLTLNIRRQSERKQVYTPGTLSYSLLLLFVFFQRYCHWYILSDSLKTFSSFYYLRFYYWHCWIPWRRLYWLLLRFCWSVFEAIGSRYFLCFFAPCLGATVNRMDLRFWLRNSEDMWSFSAPSLKRTTFS